MLLSKPAYMFVLMLGVVLILALATADGRVLTSKADPVSSCHRTGQSVGQTVAMSGFDLVGLRPCIVEEPVFREDLTRRALPAQLSLEFYD